MKDSVWCCLKSLTFTSPNIQMKASDRQPLCLVTGSNTCNLWRGLMRSRHFTLKALEPEQWTADAEPSEYFWRSGISCVSLQATGEQHMLKTKLFFVHKTYWLPATRYGDIRSIVDIQHWWALVKVEMWFTHRPQSPFCLIMLHSNVVFSELLMCFITCEVFLSFLSQCYLCNM